MIRKLLEELRHETRFVIHIATRDLMKHVSALALILLICWHAGHREAVLVIAALALLAEVGARLIAARLPARDEDLGIPVMVAMWAINVGSTIIYMWPAVLLAGQTSTALLLTGLIWLFGIFVHISNSFVALPLFNWSQSIPGFGVALLVLREAERQVLVASPHVDWMMAAGAMVVYGANTVQTLAMQKDTHAALALARAEANARLRAYEHLARHDALTGLLTRQAFDEEVSELLARARRGSEVAVLLFDLDGFKPINDTYSHEAGDAVLKAVAARIAATAGAGGVAARLGGDEFAVAVPGLPSPAAALEHGRRAREAIERPIAWRQKELRIGVSIGIALSGVAGNSVSALCGAADQAMFRAKSEPGAGPVLYQPGAFAPRLTLEDRRILSEALASGQIRPHYQPKVRLDTGALIGFEALARWQHPGRGLLLPRTFLPQINELGLQGDFLNAMTRAVLEDIAALLAEGLDPGQVSVNVPEVALATHSGRADLERILSEAPRAAGSITLEITEDVFIARAGGMIKDSIAAFRRAGIRVALDDFGTGFASFQHLRQLEFDEMKIDQSFVADLGRDPVADVLVRGFLSIAEGLGITVIAEGVETDAQRQILLQLGCRFAQGFRFGRAAPLDETRVRLTAEAMRGLTPAAQRARPR